LGVIRLILENGLRLPLGKIFHRAFALGGRPGKDPAPELMAFFADRLKVHLREKGVRHDLVAAVFALGGEDDLVRLLARVDALAGFLGSEDGANLLVAYRRAANIVRIETKKDGKRYEETPDSRLFAQEEERRLSQRLAESRNSSTAALGREAFAEGMATLASLRGPVDEFFDKVTVNCDEASLRENRLRLLAQISGTLNAVADFSLIEG
jgi:glycyl-tRNA synthetase beta chain